MLTGLYAPEKEEQPPVRIEIPAYVPRQDISKPPENPRLKAAGRPALPFCSSQTPDAVECRYRSG